jgi:hypothetical protein
LKAEEERTQSVYKPAEGAFNKRSDTQPKRDIDYAARMLEQLPDVVSDGIGSHSEAFCWEVKTTLQSSGSITEFSQDGTSAHHTYMEVGAG